FLMGARKRLRMGLPTLYVFCRDDYRKVALEAALSQDMNDLVAPRSRCDSQTAFPSGSLDRLSGVREEHSLIRDCAKIENTLALDEFIELLRRQWSRIFLKQRFEAVPVIQRKV